MKATEKWLDPLELAESFIYIWSSSFMTPDWHALPDYCISRFGRSAAVRLKKLFSHKSLRLFQTWQAHLCRSTSCRILHESAAKVRLDLQVSFNSRSTAIVFLHRATFSYLWIFLLKTLFSFCRYSTSQVGLLSSVWIASAGERWRVLERIGERCTSSVMNHCPAQIAVSAPYGTLDKVTSMYLNWLIWLLQTIVLLTKMAIWKVWDLQLWILSLDLRFAAFAVCAVMSGLLGKSTSKQAG